MIGSTIKVKHLTNLLLTVLAIFFVSGVLADSVDRGVNDGANDGYQSSETLSVFQSNREYGLTGEDDDASYHYNGWFRFASIAILPGSTINSATLRIKSTTDSFGSGTANTILYGVDEDNHIAPTNTATWQTDHSIHTSASATWDFTIIDSDDITMDSPDISSIIQEIVNRSGWSSGNAIGIHWDENMSDIDRAQGWATYENTSYTQPKLIIDWTPPGITLSTTSITATEDGSTGQYTIVLNEAPSADVVASISVLGSDITRSPASLTFTTSNWATPQTVTITAVDDDLDENNENHTVTHSVSSSDNSYDGMSISDVTVTVTDNDTAGITITETDSSTDVEEGGGTDTYTVVLDSKPTASVSVVISTDDGQVTTNPVGPLTFTTSDWNTPQTITVTAVDDEDVEDIIHADIISHKASSSDAKYSGLEEQVVVHITDNDVLNTGWLQSSTFDTGKTNGFAINSIMWNGTQNSGSVSFQLAVFYGDGDINFTGPNNSSVAVYEADEGVPVRIESANYHPFESGYQYFRYKVYINKGATDPPVINEIIINYSS